MTYWRFASYNIFGGMAWIAVFVYGGYYFGTLPMVKDNFTLVILAIVVITILPGVIEFWRQHNRSWAERA
jgi:membrane-associated protein